MYLISTVDLEATIAASITATILSPLHFCEFGCIIFLVFAFKHTLTLFFLTAQSVTTTLEPAKRNGETFFEQLY